MWALRQLGLDPESSLVNAKLVKAAFQVHALAIHPDKNQDEVAAATAAMTDLNNAYDILKIFYQD